MVNVVWIGNWIYCTFILIVSNNYDSLTGLYIAKHTVTTAHKKSLVTACEMSMAYWTTSPNYAVPVQTGHKMSSITVCSLIAGKTTFPQSSSLLMGVVLPPVYKSVTWQWMYMLQYETRIWWFDHIKKELEYSKHQRSRVWFFIYLSKWWLWRVWYSVS